MNKKNIFRTLAIAAFAAVIEELFSVMTKCSLRHSLLSQLATHSHTLVHILSSSMLTRAPWVSLLML